MKIAKVVVNLSLDRAFDYLVPRHLQDRVRVGARVRVPFGKGGGTRIGYVVGGATTSLFPDLKEISGMEGEREQIPDNLIRLAQWIADYYCCSKEQAVRAMLPAVVRSGRVSKKQQNYARLESEADLGAILPQLEKRAPKQATVLQILVRNPQGMLLSHLSREAGAGPDAARRLVEKKVITIEKRVVERDPFADDDILRTEALVLTPDQRRAVDCICSTMRSETPGVVLVHGVTGSGKTEVYLQAIAECLKDGREAIVLVPEIALTPQTTERFRARFGDTVSVLHSRLSDGERFDEWTKIREGRVKIVVGARSALFAPFTRLGLIVVDEEHETTFKQEEAPRYHARDVSVVRGKLEGAAVVLGSATPALESHHNVRIGKYQLATLPIRVDDRVMPVMEVVDMRAEAASRGGAQIYSRRLESLIRDRLDRGEQTILFLNRRGYASQMICTRCGYVAECPDCSITYTYHRHSHQLMCHLCGRVIVAPETCPQCQDREIRFTGLGTEKVEAFARKLFPKAVIARMDSDTMTGKNSYRDTLNAVRTGRVNILIGTQMIAKGLHFPNVTLVGVIFADLGLHMPDFRAGERTFQLLTQVSGRAGRGDVPGHVVVQSYTPFHSALHHAVEHNVKGFVDEELEAREALAYPPFTHLMRIVFRGESEMKVGQAAEAFADALREVVAGDSRILFTGPMPASFAKIRGRFRYHLLIRGGSALATIRILRKLTVGVKTPRDVEVYVDIDPQSLM